MWHNAKVRDASCGIAVGTKVLVAQSTVKHTSIGKCWWVYDGVAFRQIAETFGGKNLCKVIVSGKVFKDQPKISARHDKFMQKFAKLRYFP